MASSEATVVGCYASSSCWISSAVIGCCERGVWPTMKRRLTNVLSCAVMVMFTACGGGSSPGTAGSSPSPPPMAPGSTPPSIVTQPGDATEAVGQTATFQVVASGTGPLSYQWYVNKAAISGATSASYTTPAVTATDNGEMFYVVVQNVEGAVTSNTVTLTVTGMSVQNPTDVVTFKNDVGRTAQNLSETVLTPASVNATNFGLLHLLSVDGKVDAQPLYLSQLMIAGAAHDVVFVATEH